MPVPPSTFELIIQLDNTAGETLSFGHSSLAPAISASSGCTISWGTNPNTFTEINSDTFTVPVHACGTEVRITGPNTTTTLSVLGNTLKTAGKGAWIEGISGTLPTSLISFTLGLAAEQDTSQTDNGSGYPIYPKTLKTLNFSGKYPTFANYPASVTSIKLPVGSTSLTVDLSLCTLITPAIMYATQISSIISEIRLPDKLASFDLTLFTLIDANKGPQLSDFTIRGNGLTALPNLGTFNWQSLTLNCPKLTQANFPSSFHSTLTSLNVTNCPLITNITAASAYPNLVTISVSNKLVTLSLRSCTKLTTINVNASNAIATLDLQGCTLFVATLDVRSWTKLTNLNISSTGVTKLYAAPTLLIANLNSGIVMPKAAILPAGWIFNP